MRKQLQLALSQLNWKVARIAPPSPTLNNLPQLLDEYNLCSLLGYSGKFPWYAAKFTERLYKQFFIDKDTNEILEEYVEGRNLREINAPAASLKALQRKLVNVIFDKLPKHPANFAYMKGKTIHDACTAQKDGDVTIAIDIKDFFASHRRGYIKRRLMDLTGYSDDICYFVARLCTLKGSMPQGAVSSPMLSIVLNYDMDEKIQALAAEHNLVYTRYADDMQFSGSDRTDKFCWDFVNALVKLISPFKMNWKKVRIMRNKCKIFQAGWTAINTDDRPLGEIMEGLKDNIPDDFVVAFHRNSVDIRLKSVRDIIAGKVEQFSQVKDILEAAGLTIVDKRWFIQGTRRMLGLNLVDGVKYPRKKYRKLRLEAMAYGLGKHLEPMKFRGLLSYIRSVDQDKFNKLDAIVKRYTEKQMEESEDGTSNV